MFGSWVLDVGIGLIVVFILFATICSSVREGIEACMKTRASFLERGIRELLNDKKGTGLNRLLYEHPLIFSLFSGDYQTTSQRQAPSIFDRGRNLPSYIPSRSFALALFDLVARGPVRRDPESSGTTLLMPASGTLAQAPQSLLAPPLTLEALRARIGELGSEPLSRVMLAAIDTAGGDLEVFLKNIEEWFDRTMERVSGWYRRKTNLIVFLIALVLAGAFNIDSFAIANHLYRNQADRDTIVKQAEAMLNKRAAEISRQSGALASQQAQSTPKPAAKAAPEASGAVASQPDARTNDANSPPLLFNDSLSLPIGWTTLDHYASWRVVPLMLAGWLVTAIAATLGAPFWFDVLGKIMIVRSTFKRYDTSSEKQLQEGSPFPRGPGAVVAPRKVPLAAPQGPRERRGAGQLPFDAAGKVDGGGASSPSDVEDNDLPAAQGRMK